MTNLISAQTASARSWPADFKMSSRTRAIEAVDLLLEAGHSGAHHLARFTGDGGYVVRVPITSPEVSREVSRLVHAVDPKAQLIAGYAEPL